MVCVGVLHPSIFNTKRTVFLQVSKRYWSNMGTGARGGALPRDVWSGTGARSAGAGATARVWSDIVADAGTPVWTDSGADDCEGEYRCQRGRNCRCYPSGLPQSGRDRPEEGNSPASMPERLIDSSNTDQLLSEGKIWHISLPQSLSKVILIYHCVQFIYP